jgi:hypothetical protein
MGTPRGPRGAYAAGQARRPQILEAGRLWKAAISRGAAGAQHVEVRHPALGEHLLGGASGGRGVRGGTDRVVEDQAGLLLDRHPGQQVRDAFAHAAGGVLVRMGHCCS